MLCPEIANFQVTTPRSIDKTSAWNQNSDYIAPSLCHKIRFVFPPECLHCPPNVRQCISWDNEYYALSDLQPEVILSREFLVLFQEDLTLVIDDLLIIDRGKLMLAISTGNF